MPDEKKSLSLCHINAMIKNKLVIMKKIFTGSLLLSFVSIGFAQNELKAKAEELVAKMTTEEKVSLLVGKGMKFPGATQSNAGTGV